MDGMSELKGLPPDAKPDDDSNEKGKYMTFKSGNENFGLAIQYVNEIIRCRKLQQSLKRKITLRGLSI